MEIETDDMLVSMFERLIREQHPVSYARARHTFDEQEHAAIWAQLTEGGWLEIGHADIGAGHGAETLGFGEAIGRSLLTLPLGFCAYVLRQLGEAMPELIASGTVLDLDAPASGRIDAGGNADRFIDYHGPGVQYYRLAPSNPKWDTWVMQRYAGDDVSVVDGLDGCVALGTLPDQPAVAECVFTLPRQQVVAILRRYLALELADMLGAASASLDMAIAYAKERRQFGRLIGQYQAVKHPLANAWVALDNGRYAIRQLLGTATAHDGGSGSGIEQTANRLVTAAATQATKLAIQVHGGVGFAWEHDAHLFLKRVYPLAVRTRQLSGMIGGANKAIAAER
ncbi:acyl-CoA dehydrogenase family protein [Cupriavidus sp. L7L]|uniref:acyl-CoA dehydrogenase family protein n=1 Tax=Cupriavidus sp. L7L TaxID=2546443 RepID=UPI0010548798|nr:acyl-CoA dehydrogenase family protein [Cupriavidus sp. L7L]TDF64502.1 acyl-CoA dehydrogenase [Cupriavidus sp. L7L]